jgi:hypothetical protein
MSERPPPKPSGAPREYDRRIAHYENAEGSRLLEELARRRGIGVTALLRQLTREEARRVHLINGEDRE